MSSVWSARAGPQPQVLHPGGETGADGPNSSQLHQDIHSLQGKLLYAATSFKNTFLKGAFLEITRNKKLFDIPVPSQDVTYQTLPGQELWRHIWIIPAQKW
jgi:hypothetical protein